MSIPSFVFWFAVGYAIRTVQVALTKFIKRKMREHERIVNEKILRGIK